MFKELSKVAKSEGIQYFLISYTDLFGAQRAKLVPARAIDEMQRNGAGFAGFATALDMTPADPDMFAMADPDSLIRLPWKPEVAWVASDLVMGGKPVETSSRAMLKRQIARAAAKGYRMKSGVECEFFLLRPDGYAASDPSDVQARPAYDQMALMRRFDIIAEISNAMLTLGWNPYQSDHEDTNGQFEMNWEYDDCLLTADRHVFFRYMVKTMAEKHGYRASFMPKPFLHLTGSGCHSHVSLWDKSGAKNLFHDPKGELGLSKLAYAFLGGVMHNADALCAFTNPTVNSYKRLNAPRSITGATWAPNMITYGGNNRTHMVRIPDAGRFEFRLPDSAANPYLLQASLLAAGLDGIENKRDPGPRLDINMYTEAHKAKNVKRLPGSLLDGLRVTEKSKVVRAAFGDVTVDSYVKLKLVEWLSYVGHLSTWEIEHTLDC